MSQANVDLIRAIYGAFAAGDIPGVLGRMSPDIVWNEALAGRPAASAGHDRH